MTIEELVKNLREEAEAVQAIEWDIPICTANHILEAADAIERLQRERDAAVRDLRDECGCTFCRFGEYEMSELPRRCRDCFHFENWEWRGVHD